jgi:hypothetical protein
MKKFVSALLIILTVISITGCSKISKEDKNKVEALVTKLQTFKGDASPDNVEQLYKDIEANLSPDMQKSFEEINIPNAKNNPPSKFAGNEITDIKKEDNLDYYGVACEGYVVESTYKWIESETKKEVAFKCITEIVEYDGNLIITFDSDLPMN